MKHLFSSAVVCLAICAAMAGCKKEDPDRTVKVYSTVGEVTITANAAEKRASVGDILSAGDSIRTGDNSIADVLFGTAGIIRIQPGSTIAMAALMDQATGDTQIDMSSGRMNVTLARLKKGEFRVKTGTAVAAVRGTTFRITADEKAMRLDVVTGAVRVNPVQNNAVIASVEKTVETNQTVELDEKAVKEAVDGKKGLTVTELKPEEAEQIREEVKDIRPEIIEKLNVEARKEVKEKVLGPDDSAERDKEKQEREKIEKEKQEKERAMKLLRDRQLRERELRGKPEKEKLVPRQVERKKSEESRDDGPSSPPPSVNTL